VQYHPQFYDFEAFSRYLTQQMGPE